MSSPSLHDFVARVLADDRNLSADSRRLQRDILPERITTREEAEILLLLDSVVHKTDREWTAYLTATVRDFAVWGLHPAGSVDRPIQALDRVVSPGSMGEGVSPSSKASVYERVRSAWQDAVMPKQFYSTEFGFPLDHLRKRYVIATLLMIGMVLPITSWQKGRANWHLKVRGGSMF
jgi:hypothetical protein